MEMVFMQGTEQEKVLTLREVNGRRQYCVTGINSQVLKDWKTSPETVRYVNRLCEINGGNFTPIIVEGQGKNRKTWIDESLIINFARYVSVDFDIWCDMQIKKLLTEGKVELESELKAIKDKLADEHYLPQKAYQLYGFEHFQVLKEISGKLGYDVRQRPLKINNETKMVNHYHKDVLNYYLGVE